MSTIYSYDIHSFNNILSNFFVQNRSILMRFYIILPKNESLHMHLHNPR